MSRNPSAAFHPVFDWKHTPAQIDWSDVNASKRLSIANSAKVTAEQAAGRNYGKMHGISKKSDDRLANHHHGGAYGLAVARKASIQLPACSETEKLRTCLKAGASMSSAELQAATGVPVVRIPSLLKYDRKNGRIKQVRGARPFRYRWVDEGCYFASAGEQARRDAEARA